MRPIVWTLLILLPALAGCVSESAALVLGARQHSISLVRTKDYWWSKAWDLELVVARLPACQRRHALKKTSSDTLEIEVYWSGRPGLFGLRHGKRWYLTDTASCALQVMDQELEDPGERIGVFRVKDGKLIFELAEQQKASGQEGAQTDSPTNGQR